MLATRLTTFLLVMLLAPQPSFASEDQAPTRPPAQRPSTVPPPPGTWPSRGFIGITGGYQARTIRFEGVQQESIGGEPSTWQANYEVKNGVTFDIGAGYRVWKNLVVAGSYSRYSKSDPAAISGQIPHPFFFNQHRMLSAETGALDHEESAVHAGLMWMAPVSRRLEVGVFGGPSFFSVKQTFVEDVLYSETYPYDVVSFTRAETRDESKSQVGFHAGVDVTWLFTPQLGVGGLVRYSQASVDLSTPPAGEVSFDVGGLQAGVGIRIRFPDRRPVAPPRPPARDPKSAPTPAQPPSAPPSVAAAITTTTAPVFIRPDATRTPLRQLPPDTRVRVLENAGEWLRIEFDDAQFGRRVGYIQTKHVRLTK